MDINIFTENPQSYGRRKGRKLSKSGQLAIRDGKDYLIKEEDIPNIFHNQKYIVLEIGFGDGENLINSAKINPNFFYIGADPFLNTTAKCLGKILQYKLKNIAIWQDDVRKILKFITNNSISEIKIINSVMKHKGTITIATDHDQLKKWVLEKFQSHIDFEWVVETSEDWRLRPNDCFQTKYELKSINQQRKPSWFIFKKQ